MAIESRGAMQPEQTAVVQVFRLHQLHRASELEANEYVWNNREFLPRGLLIEFAQKGARVLRQRQTHTLTSASSAPLDSMAAALT